MKKNRNVLPYVGFTIRIIFGLGAIAVAMIFFAEMIDTATTRISYALCYLVPVAAVGIIGGDLYLRYKMDIGPLRKKKDREQM